MNNVREFTPPYSEEAEQAVIGTLLHGGEKINSIVFKNLISLDFFVAKYQLIFDVCKELTDSLSPVTTITVSEKLENKGELIRCGGSAGLSELIDSIPSLSTFEHYVEIVKKKSYDRNLYTAMLKAKDLYKSGMDLEQAIDMSISQVLITRETNDYTDISKDTANFIANMQRQLERTDKLSGLSTGFKYLDEKLDGLQNGLFYVVAARPAMGKTALIMNIAKNISCADYVGVISMEMDLNSLQARLIASDCEVNSRHVKNPRRATDNELEKIAIAADNMHNYKLLVNDKRMPLSKIRSWARYIVMKYNAKALFIDHMQIISPESDTRNYNRYSHITEISGELKQLAKTLNIPVICLSQLSRNVENRENKRPTLADLRESGAIEQDADCIMFMYRGDYYNDPESKPGETEIDFAKMRDGESEGIEKIEFFKEYTLFKDYENKLKDW